MSEQLGSFTDLMLDVYLCEAHELLGQLEEILACRQRDGAFDEDCISRVFRIMHTLKGSSAMMCFESVEALARGLEDVFAVMRERGGIPGGLSPELCGLLLEARELLRAEIGNIEDKQPLTIHIGHLTEKIMAFLKKIQDPQGPLGRLPEAGETREAALAARKGDHT